MSHGKRVITTRRRGTNAKGRGGEGDVRARSGKSPRGWKKSRGLRHEEVVVGGASYERAARVRGRKGESWKKEENSLKRSFRKKTSMERVSERKGKRKFGVRETSPGSRRRKKHQERERRLLCNRA